MMGWCSSATVAAGRERKVIRTIELDSATSSTPVAAHGVLYVTTMRKLYALQKPQ
jgi:hypothetical protein